MRILINDHAGHPFQVQLSRALAAKGHDVLHTYCTQLCTPRGALERLEDDPEGFDIRGISIDEEFARYSLTKRYLQERALGREMTKCVRDFQPDAVVSANTPLGEQAALLKACRNIGASFVFWVQDLLGVGINAKLKKKLPGVGHAIGHYFMNLERTLLRNSDQVIVITEDFRRVLADAGVDDQRLQVIHNWAPLEDMPVQARINPWSLEQGLDGRFTFVYSGTLGMKHNPEMLIRLALQFQDDPEVEIVIVSEGIGADYLKERTSTLNLDNLSVLPFQPFKKMPQVLGSADVLLGVLEPSAGIFSVPSKVLTYLCTQRPLLLAVPQENLAARIVHENNAGLTVPPDDVEGFLENAKRLEEDATLRGQLAANGRRYAEKHFNINKITDRFENILQQTTRHTAK